ncbi:MAG: division/cell wall cluster transcriptional repressor MraZ [Alphaproteobacteria bacterium]|nr:division/cell wall cluster transcriptional repressor MraZ [Alphaproteobacteria bacterium]
MALFISTYTNRIDKKGRVSVPAPFRAVIARQDFQGIIAYGSFINPCIEACALSRIEQMSESIDTLDPFSEERDAFAATILAGSVQLSFDGEGRIMLPESLIASAELNEQAVFVGKGKTFEIWEPSRFETYFNKARQTALSQRGAFRLHTQSKMDKEV